MNTEEMKAGLANFSETLKGKGFTDEQVNETLDGLIKIIMQSSFNAVLENLGKDKSKEILARVEEGGTKDASAVINSFFKFSADYITQEKLEEIVNQESQKTVAEFLKTIN